MKNLLNISTTSIKTRSFLKNGLTAGAAIMHTLGNDEGIFLGKTRPSATGSCDSYKL